MEHWGKGGLGQDLTNHERSHECDKNQKMEGFRRRRLSNPYPNRRFEYIRTLGVWGEGFFGKIKVFEVYDKTGDLTTPVRKLKFFGGERRQ